MKRRELQFGMLIIISVGLFLRLYRLGYFSLWFDEALVALQSKDLGTLWQGTGTGSLPPLYYTLIHFVSYLGNSEFALRLPSLVFGMLSIIMIYLIGSDIFSKQVGLISAFILSVSPFHIYYSQEAKMYTLLVFLALLSVYFCIKLLKQQNILFNFLFIVTATAGLYTHYFFFLVILAENILFVFWKEKTLRLIKGWIIAHTFIFLLYLWWFPVFLLRHLPQTVLFFSKLMPVRGNLVKILITLKHFAIGYNASMPFYLFSSILFLLLFTFGLFSIRKDYQKSVFVLSFLAAPIFMTLIASLKLHIYLDRFLIWSSPFFYITVACGISAIINKEDRFLLFITILVLSLFSLLNYYHNIWPNIVHSPFVGAKLEYRQAADFIKSNFREGDVIIHPTCSSLMPFRYYINRRKDQYCVVVHPQQTGSLLRPWASRQVAKQMGAFPLDIENGIEGYKRIWLVFDLWQFRYLKPIPYETKKWLDYHCLEIYGQAFKGVRTHLYLNREFSN